jgi:putative thioredoxin
MDVTAETWQQDVIERSHERPVVVDFWAAWCGPCRALTPVLEAEIGKRAGEVELAKVDVDANHALAAEFGVSGIPAVNAFRNGRVVDEFVGARGPALVASFLDGLTGPSAGERLLEELRASGEFPEVVAALEAGDHETALAAVLDAVEEASAEERTRLREIAVTLFADLGHEHPVTVAYRRRLATALY